MNTKNKTDKTAQGKPELPEVVESEHGTTYINHVYNRKTMAYEPQAEHSPLPWHISRLDDDERMIRDANQADIAVLVGANEPDAKLIVASVNQAQAMAEALREAIIRMDHLLDDASGEHSPTYNIAREALANWEGAK